MFSELCSRYLVIELNTASPWLVLSLSQYHNRPIPGPMVHPRGQCLGIKSIKSIQSISPDKLSLHHTPCWVPVYFDTSDKGWLWMLKHRGTCKGISPCRHHNPWISLSSNWPPIVSSYHWSFVTQSICEAIAETECPDIQIYDFLKTTSCHSS